MAAAMRFLHRPFLTKRFPCIIPSYSSYRHYSTIPFIFHRHRRIRRFLQKRFGKRLFSAGFGRGNWDKADFYSVLGVSKTATSREIKSAYYKLAKQFHPDANEGKPKAEKDKAREKFKEIQEAHEVLGDDKTREEYDMHRKFMDSGRGSFSQGFGAQSRSGRRPYDPYEYMRNRQQQQTDWQRSWGSQQQAGSQADYERQRFYQQAYSNPYGRGAQNPFQERMEVHQQLARLFKFWLYGMMFLILLSTFTQMSSHKAGRPHGDKEGRSEMDRYLFDQERNRRYREVLRQMDRDRRPQGGAPRRRPDPTEGGYPPYISLRDAKGSQLFKIRLKEEWHQGHPTYRGQDLPDVPGQYMVLWFEKESQQWRLSLKKYVGTDMCYAYVQDGARLPNQIQQTWQVYDTNSQEYKFTQSLRFSLPF